MNEKPSTISVTNDAAPMNAANQSNQQSQHTVDLHTIEMLQAQVVILKASVETLNTTIRELQTRVLDALDQRDKAIRDYKKAMIAASNWHALEAVVEALRRPNGFGQS